MTRKHWHSPFSRYHAIRGATHKNASGQARYEPTDAMWAERDRAYGAEQDITAILCGDPKPGRSALDRGDQEHESNMAPADATTADGIG